MSYRFGLKKLPEKARAEVYLRSKFALKPKEEEIVIEEAPVETTCIFYPGTIDVNNPVDGSIDRMSSIEGGEPWQDIRTFHPIYTYPYINDLAFWVGVHAHENPNKWYSLSRSIILFDTLAIGSAVIKNAQLSVRIVNLIKGSNFTDDEVAVCLVSSNPENQDQLIKQDWDTFGTELFAYPVPYDEYFEKFQNNEPVIFQMNDAGLAAINKEGITKLGLMLKCDFLDQEPAWQNGSVMSVGFCSRNASVESLELWPQLIVTLEGEIECPEPPEGGGIVE